MIPYKGSGLHDPENGVYGDCFRTAVACLLETPPSEVPHFATVGQEDGEMVRETRAWLRKEKALDVFEVALLGDLSDVLGCMEVFNQDVYYILSGRSSLGVNHCVIAKGGTIVHDTSPDETGIVGRLDNDAYQVTVLVPHKPSG